MTVARFAAVETVDVDASLTAAERARHDRLVHAEDRVAYRAAHLLVRACAGELLSVAPSRLELIQTCPRCPGSDHGRPAIAGHPDVHVSLSHTRGVVAAIAAHRACGVDVEGPGATVVERALSRREVVWVRLQRDPVAAFTRLWVRKEALVKAGGGSLERLDAMDVLRPPTGWHVVDWQDDGASGAWTVAQD